jgi:hypothetical protein
MVFGVGWAGLCIGYHNCDNVGLSDIQMGLGDQPVSFAPSPGISASPALNLQHPSMTEYSVDEKVQIAASFLLESPPGEVNDVFNGKQLLSRWFT